MHTVFANHSTARLIKALNTAAVSHEESVHTLMAVTQQYFYMFTTAWISVTHSKGKFSRWRWALIWREGREEEGCKGSWMHWLWKQTGTEWAPEFRTQPLSLAVDLWALWSVFLGQGEATEASLGQIFAMQAVYTADFNEWALVLSWDPG